MKEGMILTLPKGFSPIGFCVTNCRFIPYNHQSFCLYDTRGQLLNQTLFPTAIKSAAFHPKKEFGYIISDNAIPSISSVDMKGVVHKTFYPNRPEIEHISYDPFGGLFLHTTNENFRLFFTMSSIHTVPVSPYFVGTKDKYAALNVANGELLYYNFSFDGENATIYKERIYILAK